MPFFSFFTSAPYWWFPVWFYWQPSAFSSPVLYYYNFLYFFCLCFIFILPLKKHNTTRREVHMETSLKKKADLSIQINFFLEAIFFLSLLNVTQWLNSSAEIRLSLHNKHKSDVFDQEFIFVSLRNNSYN